ncbi:TPA: hypothetical protein ACH3X2_012387 [Trebouxia sp. C0005]
MEGCADFERLTVRPLFTYSPPVVAVRFGHLYKGDASQRDVEGLVWQSILTQLSHLLIAMDPQRLGTPTAACDLHFQEQFLQQKHDLFNRGFLTVEYLGKREQLPASSKGSQVSPRYAEVIVKQLDPRSIQFQGLSVSISVSRSLQNKHEQRKAKAADTSGKQARRKAKKVKRQASKQQSGQRQASPPQLARSGVASTQPAMEQQGLVYDDEPLLTAIFPLPGGITSLPIVEGPPAALARLHPAPSSGAGGLGSPLPVASSPRASMPDAASPLAGKRRGPESVSNVESLGAIEAPTADSLALVPLTPDDSHAPSLRRSSRDHKKPRPYYAASQVEPPDKPSTSQGLQRGFLK